MRGCGILVDEIAFLDHLVPLLQILGFPLLVCDPWLKELVEIYYPPMEILVAEDYCLDAQLEPFDTYIYSEFYRRPTGYFQFGKFFSQRSCRSIFLFHGIPDKHHDLFWLEQLAGEDIVLLHGPQTERWLQEKALLPRMRKTIFCGNYRFAYFEKERAFFPKKERTILYAPTWVSPVQHSGRRAHYSTVLEDYAVVKETLHDFPLTIKLHPYFEKLFPQEAKEMETVRTPVIYPLLEETEIFIGDHSSIVYDFLKYERPILLFNKRAPWAETVTHATLREAVLHAQAKREEQQKAYLDAFGPPVDLDTLKEEIWHAY